MINSEDLIDNDENQKYAEVETATTFEQTKDDSNVEAIEKNGNCSISGDPENRNSIWTSNEDAENVTFSILSHDPKLEAYLLEEPAIHKLEVLGIPNKMVSNEQSARKIYPDATDTETQAGPACTESIEGNDIGQGISKDRSSKQTENVVYSLLSQHPTIRHYVLTLPTSPGLTRAGKRQLYFSSLNLPGKMALNLIVMKKPRLSEMLYPSLINSIVINSSSI